MTSKLEPDEVYAYDETGNHMVPTKVRVGDDVEWKRNGITGSFIARVLEIGPEKIKIRVLRHKGNGHELTGSKAIWINKRLMRVLRRSLQDLTPDTIKVTESIHGTHYYHLSQRGSDSKAICGASAMLTQVPLSGWGYRGHLCENYCRNCDLIGRQGGLNLRPLPPVTPAPGPARVVKRM